ncbi:hypothetical protein CBR_g39560 [Chara braunii]|uniref:Transmembrane protein 53 n=1 Tax=Chara braunii TaxID=69332 RepID=A0A388LRY3_CHABU|nr:hypothetical protein CBR_g39560 [Chara braunii]|eukprot:GBG85100.1 hypothetical protein CBR_g39560 [Chara braunii]
MPVARKGDVSEMGLYWTRSTEGCVVRDHHGGTPGLEVRNEPGRRDGLESSHVGDNLPASYRSSPAFGVQAEREDADVAAYRPIVVLFGWMMSKRVHTTKYAQLYNQSGWDTLTCHPPTLHMWLPTRALHLAIQVLDELVKELQGRLRPIVLATFSGGSKACHYKLLQDAYGHIRRCVVGQIFDSSPIDHVSSLGVRFLSRRPGHPASPVRTAAAWGAAKLLDFFMLSESERQRVELRQTQVASAVIGPMLVIYSKDDDLAPAEYIDRFIADVTASGGRAHSLCWEKSEHVGPVPEYQR